MRRVKVTRFADYSASRRWIKLTPGRLVSRRRGGQAVDDDQFLSSAAGPDDVDLAVEDGEEAVGVAVVLEQDLAGGDLARPTVREQPIQLGRGQPREQSLTASTDGDELQSGRSCILSRLLDYWRIPRGHHGENVRAHRGGDGSKASGRAEVRGMREEGRALGAPAHLPDLRRDPLL
jgi:hypothetical protein